MRANVGALCALLLLLGVADSGGIDARPADTNWDVAVAVNEGIVLLSSNGTLLSDALDLFSEIKALTYHFKRSEFVVADRRMANDTIYVLSPSSMVLQPVVEDLADDIQAITMDMRTETIFWADATNQSINAQSLLGETTGSFNALLSLRREFQDIAMDGCTDTVFWTRSNLQAPAIEKASMMDAKPKVLVDSDLCMPSGLAIDQLEQRVYWADKRQGIYFRIESVDLDGNDRRIFFQGTHQRPHRLAVDASFVYWTDTSNNALWRKSKRNASGPEIVHSFHGTPSGIVARFVGFPEAPDCDKLALLISERRKHKSDESPALPELIANKSCALCMNGNLNAQDCTCSCKPGFTGAQCSLELCYNYCHHGQCQISSEGKPQCACEKGYNDTRCERHVCDNYCLNGGACSLEHGSSAPKCACSRGFDGQRCDLSLPVNNLEICQSVCANTSANIIVHNQNSFLCRCSDLALMSFDASNCTQTASASISADMKEIIKHPVFIGMITGNLITLLLVIMLIGYIGKQRRMRPRIKKRVVVNKNVTPLTYRPQTGEVCEITIEDCCNMNICETPCFEPRNFHSKKEDKKALLGGMENNEEFY